MSRRITALLFSSTFALFSAGALAADPAPTQGADTKYGAGPGMTNLDMGETTEGAEGAEGEAEQVPGTRPPGEAGSEDAPGALGEGSDPGTRDGSTPPIGGSTGGMDEGTMDDMDRDGALGRTP